MLQISKNQIAFAGEQRSRVAWVDWAKSLGIFLVVLGHMKVLMGKPLIYMFHMAFFYMLSGYLFKPNTLKKELSKSTKTLLIPFAFFNIILLVISALVKDYEFGMIPNILLCNYELFPVRYFSPLWFLVSLFIMRLICSVFSERWFPAIAIVAFLCSIVLFYTHSFPLDKESDYYQWATTVICLPSYIMGFLLKKNNCLDLFDRVKNSYLRYGLITIVITILVIMGLKNGRVNVFTCAVGKDILVYYFVSTGVSYVGMYLISKFFNKNNSIVQTISTGTILILALHVAMIDGLSYGIKMNSLYSVALALLIMFIGWVLIQICLKYTPFVLGRKK